MTLDEIPKWTLAAQEAVDRENETWGFDIRKVLDDSDWIVAVIDGIPTTMVDKVGVRKLALFAPDQELAAAIVNHIEDNL